MSTVRLRPSARLVVAFGGIRQKLGPASLEFYRSLEQVDCAALFVSDSERRWYQYPADIIDSLMDQVRAAAQEAGASRLVFIGNSMGGFAALHFGARMGADAILGFGAQTAILPEVTRELGDMRWSKHQALIPSYPFGDLAREAPPKGRTVLCWAKDQPLDRAHAQRLARVWPLEHLIVPGGDHAAAAHLRDAGELGPLLRQAIAGEGRFS